MVLLIDWLLFVRQMHHQTHLLILHKINSWNIYGSLKTLNGLTNARRHIGGSRTESTLPQFCPHCFSHLLSCLLIFWDPANGGGDVRAGFPEEKSPGWPPPRPPQPFLLIPTLTTQHEARSRAGCQEQCLAHSRCWIHACWVNIWMIAWKDQMKFLEVAASGLC